MPVVGPVGSIWSSDGYIPCQSRHHSETPLYKFFNPHWLAPFLVGSAPDQNSVVVPARHAYSHSASVGKRFDFPSFLLSQSQNLTASFQLIPAAKGLAPAKFLNSASNFRY